MNEKYKELIRDESDRMIRELRLIGFNEQKIEIILKVYSLPLILHKFHSSIKETCVCAAVMDEEGNVIRGHRHGDCFTAIHQRGRKPMKAPNAQGFVTSRGRFVTREEGRVLQEVAGIPSADPDGYRGDTLYSEDLY